MQKYAAHVKKGTIKGWVPPVRIQTQKDVRNAVGWLVDTLSAQEDAMLREAEQRARVVERGNNNTYGGSETNKRRRSEAGFDGSACWTAPEEELLVKYVMKHGARQWNNCAAEIGTGRTGGACGKHYRTYLRPIHGHKEGTLGGPDFEVDWIADTREKHGIRQYLVCVEGL
jgi:hypothetical protein